MSDYLIRGTLAELDPAVHQLTQLEAERQYRKIILIASESSAPHAAMEATTSAFTNIYAEGYPDEETRQMSEDEILDYGPRLAHYRRYSDPRYYKGVEYADAIEALARRRCAELFATAQVPAEKIFVNVQALSGAPANNAVYNALLKPGETVMGLDLVQGGHLSHGAKANRSGAFYNSVPYGLDPATERLDYSAVRALAMQHRPKLLIAGYSSYPWVPDWAEFRRIADECGAVLLADIAHIAGLVAAGEAASPLGHAHVISFTTHKSLCGPRGACLLTTDAALARKLDRAVFPGEQGGPHINTIAGLAVVFKLNQRPQFKALQKQIRANAMRFAQQLQAHGFRVPFGGTEIHLFNLDCKSVVGAAGAPLMGEMAARILDLAGVVVNRNTIPGDRGAFYPSGLRLATPWITQRGFMEKEVDELAGHMAAVLRACVPFAYAAGRGKPLHRTRVDFKILNESKNALRDLAAFLTVPDAIRFQEAHNWDAVSADCRKLAHKTLAQINAFTGLAPLCTDSAQWLGQMVAARLPAVDVKRLQARLYGRHKVEVPLVSWNGQAFIRVSVQAYNTAGDTERLLQALRTELAEN